MRLRLASLALLLLALCRPSSAGGAVAWGDVIYTADSALTLAAATRDAHLAKLIADKSKYADLAPIMGNSLHALIFKGAGKFDALPDYYKKALVNGVLCELAEADIDKKIAKAQYGADTIPIEAAKRTKEEELAKALKPSIDCTAATPDACFCTEKKPLLYCLAKGGFTGTKPAKCLKALLGELANKGKKSIGTRLPKYDMPPMKENEADPLKPLSEPASVADFYCDGTDSEVISLVEQVYAADGLYWSMDSSGVLQMTGDSDLGKACVTDKAKQVFFMKCVCEKKMGSLPCFAQSIGKAFKDASYLDCTPAPAKFDETKKDAATTEIKKLNGGGAPQPDPAPVPGGPTGAPGGNETTTAAPSDGAATSSLLLAPLAAAAAALLLL